MAANALQQGIQSNLLTFTCTTITGSLEIDLSNRLCMTLPTPQSLKVLPKCLKVAQIAQTCNLGDSEWGVSATPPKYLRSSCCLLFWHLTV